MFNQTSNCPRCHSQISEERARQTPPVCDHCGFVITGNETKAKAEVSKNYMYGMFGVAGLIVFLHLFFSAWGGYTLEVRWLQVFGGNTPATHQRLAQICLETYQYDCTEEHYLAMANTDSKQFMVLGKFQMSRQNYKGAAESFKSFLAQNEDPNKDATFLYARSLSEIGQVDEASRFFDEIINAKTDVLQLTVIQKYVELLVKNQRWAQAQKVIDSIRKRGESVQDFMQQQYTEITAHLNDKKS